MNAVKNEYTFHGAIKLLDPVISRPYVNKKGEQVEDITRVIVVRNKYVKYGRYQVIDAEITCKRQAVEQLTNMLPGLEVIVKFSVKGVVWSPKNTEEEKYFVKLESEEIFSPTDKDKPLSWWADKHGDLVKKKKKDEEESDKPVESLTTKENKRKHPTDIKYDQKDFDKKVDYSHDESKPIDTTQEHKSTKAKEDENPLPF